MREFFFHAHDGTKLAAWTNEGSGPRVLLCNGLAAPAECWPGLLDPECGYEVVSWHHRGFLGSDRPGDPNTVTLPIQSGDALALMDHIGWDSALFLGWSFGVNMAAEIAIEEPDRMTGLLAIAGLPGGTFKALMGKNPFPPELRKMLGIATVTVGESQGWGISKIAANFPNMSLLAEILQRSGFVGKRANREEVAAMLKPYLSHDFGWYFTTAKVVAQHDELDISEITIPAEVLVGRRDPVTDPRAVERFGRDLPNSAVEVLDSTHFLPLEYPAEIIAALDRLVARTARS